MKAVSSLLLILSTLAPAVVPQDSETVTSTPPSEWNTYDYDLGDYGGMTPCAPYIPPTGNKRCPPNEHYERCAPVCQESCIKVDCLLNCCVEGCFCDDGYVRGPEGSCIRREECFDQSFPFLPQCPVEIAIACYEDSQQKRKDDGLNDRRMICNFLRVISPQDTRCPVEARQCDNPEGCSDDDDDEIHPQLRTQVLDETKPCFPDMEPQAPVECSPGEHYEECGPICFGSCIEYDCPLKCCVPGCFCPEGHVRGPTGDCIPKDQCPVETFSLSNHIEDTYEPAPVACGPEEFISCDTHCQMNCSNFHLDFKHCPDTCALGCVCRPPKIRGPDGDCILPEQCNPLPLRQEAGSFKCKRLNEELKMCTLSCPDTCEDYGDPSRACKKRCLPVPKCDCIEGFVRGPSGDCIPPEDCPNTSSESFNRDLILKYFRMRDNYKQPSSERPMEGQLFKCKRRNEELKLCTFSCPDTCDDYKDHSRICKKVCLPVPRCECIEGFVRGPSGDCITPEECPNEAISKTDACPENEEFQDCGTACPKDCNNYDEDVPCREMCSRGCFCKEPLVRGPDGRCILIEECPAFLSASEDDVCPENEEYQSCGTACPKDCTNYDRRIPCIALCAQGCFCKEPRVRGPDGTCILIEECPARLNESPVCSENEYYEECQAHCERNCTNYDMNIACSSECKGGCVCKPPLVRGPDFTCVDVEECIVMKKEQNDFFKSVRQFPTYICNENQRFTFCKSLCPDNCNNYREERFCKHVCLPGCACLPGYVISKDGVCIKKEHCVEDRPEDCSELEDYNECGSHCETDCFNFNMATRECHTSECRKGCFCKPGWVRSPDMKCVRPFDCPRRFRDPTRRAAREWPFWSG